MIKGRGTLVMGPSYWGMEADVGKNDSGDGSLLLG